MMLQFASQRLEHQINLARKGWTKLKAQSRHSGRLQDAMLTECVSAAQQLKSLITVVMNARGSNLPPTRRRRTEFEPWRVQGSLGGG